MTTPEATTGMHVPIGSVMLLDTSWLCRQRDDVDAPEPFPLTSKQIAVLVADDGDRQVWAPLCTNDRRERKERVRIEPGWKIGAGWPETDYFMRDGLGTFVAPRKAFEIAGERALSTITQPWVERGINDVGLAALIKEIRRQGGPMLEPAFKQPRIRYGGPGRLASGHSPSAGPNTTMSMAIAAATVPPSFNAQEKAPGLTAQIRRLFASYADHDEDCPAASEPDARMQLQTCSCGLSRALEDVIAHVTELQLLARSAMLSRRA